MKLFIILTHEFDKNRMNIYHVCTDPLIGYNVFGIKIVLMSRVC